MPSQVALSNGQPFAQDALTGECFELLAVVTDDDAHTGLLRLMEPGEGRDDFNSPLKC
jgi:hypothetical protein